MLDKSIKLCQNIVLTHVEQMAFFQNLNIGNSSLTIFTRNKWIKNNLIQFINNNDYDGIMSAKFSTSMPYRF